MLHQIHPYALRNVTDDCIQRLEAKMLSLDGASSASIRSMNLKPIANKNQYLALQFKQELSSVALPIQKIILIEYTQVLQIFAA